ncbi:MAG: hypothetical protein IH987_21175 [Planctomycetes bacterium]|nr:hypothetical protein [Planctomycetota bacterium]
MVDRAIDLDVQVRTRLRGRIESAAREARRRAVIETERRSRAEQNRAAALERVRLVEKTTRDEIKIRQLMERFNSLRAEGRYREAEDAALRIRKLAPNNPVTESIIHNVRFAGNIARMHDLREMRQKKFVETLNQVELSSIPFPDDRPIVYPPAEVWRELTRKRRTYRAGGREQVGGSEERIRRALGQTTMIDFIEVPLRDVVDYLADLHKIPIVIDARALDTVGMGTDTPITRRLQGISLRSALRILLRDLELTYVIRDEVLQITTQEEANANRIIKFYPVGDLIIPIQNTQVNPFAPGGGLGRAFGGGAFGGGGFGGGLGGFGGGGISAVKDEAEDLILIGKKPMNPPNPQFRSRQPK